MFSNAVHLSEHTAGLYSCRMPDGKDIERAEALRAAVGRFVRRGRQGDTMPAGQAAALGHLERDGTLSIAELAAREGVRHQSMARTVGLLAEKGLVAVSSDPADQRRVSVGVTAPGRAALQEQRERRTAWIVEAVSALPPHDAAVLNRVPALLDALSVNNATH